MRGWVEGVAEWLSGWVDEWVGIGGLEDIRAGLVGLVEG